ncbi:MAG: hypothetical protein JRN54_00595 [Nitrososphaerota archaeon]|nr:hypothetical protein [Nitrososphaerota archaeon]
MLKEDLGAFREAIDGGNAGEVVIYANRFVSDAAIFTVSPLGSTELFVGAMLRVIAEDLAQAKGRRLSEEVKELANAFVTTLGGALPSIEKNFVSVCGAYYTFEKGFFRLCRG